ncbi:unnamed protein product [Penicillium salamii]|uniref:Uncharacterized protein n=1 Tax=Penicillium salamii TaxID=1612424 RepID=A0A9W4JY81_9EURO|nr:unnamed protein product [Penicillium salamii]CAG8259045.1 unnamed protein product [Penicillium salamii]CAG8375472.1 unnamed protein product [Penicillium salamii]CAG8399615.1 unnamed protein product [Penicillium salamii]CAG8406393.1 unnamed protein product [Penicillium salamii]
MRRSLESVNQVFLDAPSVWKIVPYARNISEALALDDAEREPEKAGAADDVEMREYI